MSVKLRVVTREVRLDKFELLVRTDASVVFEVEF